MNEIVGSRWLGRLAVPNRVVYKTELDSLDRSCAVLWTRKPLYHDTLPSPTPCVGFQIICVRGNAPVATNITNGDLDRGVSDNSRVRS